MECTIWGDIDQKLECTNHHSKDRSEKIDWTLEVEEGWRKGGCCIIYSLHIS
jgi:hypothetical protein